MSISVGRVKRKAGFGNDALKKYFSTGLVFSNIDDEGLVAYMRENSQISDAAARGAVAAFKAAVATFLLNGHTVVVPYLGTFSLSSNGKSVDTLEKCTADLISNIRVRFTPTSRVNAAVKSARFVMVPLEDDAA